MELKTQIKHSPDGLTAEPRWQEWRVNLKKERGEPSSLNNREEKVLLEPNEAAGLSTVSSVTSQNQSGTGESCIADKIMHENVLNWATEKKFQIPESQ